MEGIRHIFVAVRLQYGHKNKPNEVISSGLDIISPLFENIVLGFDDYKDKKSFCNRQIKTQIFFAPRKNYSIIMGLSSGKSS